MRRIIVVFFLAFFIFGCGPVKSFVHFRPTHDELLTNDFGPYPDNYQDIVKEIFENSLYDPYSAVFKFSKPLQVRRIVEPKYSWVVCGTVNAKNRLGGYVGAKLFAVTIHDGIAIEHKYDTSAELICNVFKPE